MSQLELLSLGRYVTPLIMKHMKHNTLIVCLTVSKSFNELVVNELRQRPIKRVPLLFYRERCLIHTHLCSVLKLDDVDACWRLFQAHHKLGKLSVHLPTLRQVSGEAAPCNGQTLADLRRLMDGAGLQHVTLVPNDTLAFHVNPSGTIRRTMRALTAFELRAVPARVGVSPPSVHLVATIECHAHHYAGVALNSLYTLRNVTCTGSYLACMDTNDPSVRKLALHLITVWKSLSKLTIDGRDSFLQKIEGVAVANSAGRPLRGLLRGCAAFLSYQNHLASHPTDTLVVFVSKPTCFQLVLDHVEEHDVSARIFELAVPDKPNVFRDYYMTRVGGWLGLSMLRSSLSHRPSFPYYWFNVQGERKERPVLPSTPIDTSQYSSSIVKMLLNAHRLMHFFNGCANIRPDYVPDPPKDLREMMRASHLVFTLASAPEIEDELVLGITGWMLHQSVLMLSVDQLDLGATAKIENKKKATKKKAKKGVEIIK